MARSLLASSLENASFNIIFQVLLRCVTFILNATVLRYVSQDVVGVMNVRLLLLESTILFLSREAFRRACLSQTSGSRSWPQIINLLWLTVPLSIIASVVFGTIWVYVLVQPSHDITPHYVFGVWSMAVSCVIEMLCEPLYLVAQAFLFIRLQLVMNALTVAVRTLIFAPWVVYRPHHAVLAFSMAQLAANSAYCLGYYAYFHYYIETNENSGSAMVKKLDESLRVNSMKDRGISDCDGETTSEPAMKRPNLIQRQNSIVGIEDHFPFHSLHDFLPKAVDGEHWVHPNSVALTLSFLKQGVLKQVLTEGERYVMTLFSVMSFNEQGVYDVVNNLGSLAARFLFRPVEDACYFYFSQSIKREVPVDGQNQERMQEASTVLQQVLRCISSLGLVILTFGQGYSTLLLYLYGGAKLGEGQGPILLRAHCLSVFLLAVNGVTECYAFATMTAEKLDRYNYWMALFSGLFLIISWALTRLLGGVGFIIANCCNMAARTAHSVIFIRKRYRHTSYRPLDGLIPRKPFIVSLILAFMITKTTEIWCSRLIHFFFGATTFVVVLGTWAFNEKDLLQIAITKWRNRTKQD